MYHIRARCVNFLADPKGSRNVRSVEQILERCINKESTSEGVKNETESAMEVDAEPPQEPTNVQQHLEPAANAVRNLVKFQPRHRSNRATASHSGASQIPERNRFAGRRKDCNRCLGKSIARAGQKISNAINDLVMIQEKRIMMQERLHAKTCEHQRKRNSRILLTQKHVIREVRELTEFLKKSTEGTARRGDGA